MTRIFIMLIASCTLGFSAASATASQNDTLRSPAAGVLCDRYFCADGHGISNGLTEQYLGKAVADKLVAQGNFDRSSFTLANGIFCDVNEQRCYEDRYRDTQSGKRSPVSLHYTTALFGGPSCTDRANEQINFLC